METYQDNYSSESESHIIEEVSEQEHSHDPLDDYSDIIDNKSQSESPVIQKGFEGKSYEITMEVIDSLYDVQDFSFDRNQFYLKYKKNGDVNEKVVEQRVEQDGRV